MPTTLIGATELEERQLAVIERRLETVEPIISAIWRAVEHLPPADRVRVFGRLEQLSRRGCL